MSNRIWRAIAPATGLALLSLLAAVPAEADEGKKVRIKKIHAACEGEDCENHGEHRMIFIGGDEGIHELEERFEWIGAGEHGLRVMGYGGTFLGVQLTELSPELRAHFGVPEDQGVLVAKVVADSPAARAGVEVGDVITAVDGEAVASGAQLARLVRGYEDGQTVALELWRDGSVQTLSPTLAKRDTKARVAHLGHHGMRKIMVRCEGEAEKDCEVSVGSGDLGDFDCGGAEECEVRVECGDGGCECTVNGEAADCDSLPGFSGRNG